MHLFPESGFDQSAITPVFLGVLASWFFTETFGWVFIGLVVPGYLATLFLLDPRAAWIDVAEALVTYGAARVICEHLSLTGLTSRMFGRERFLVILVTSVLVRLSMEGVLIPWAVPHAKWAYSIGLVLVPLAANACWKTGLPRGVIQNGVPTAIVYALLRWVLVPHTNLSLAGFHLSIENVATGFLRSPRAYVLLLTGAVIAAIANVRYGWDYGGILIPALIALVVTTPTKLAATFIEATLLVVIVGLLVRFSAVGRWSIEGPRRPVLFLTTDYALRFAIAGVAGRHLPGTEIVELTGLGYLLPSLLAVKVSQKSRAALVFLPTATVSAAAFAASTVFAAIVAPADADADARASGPPVTRRVGVAPDSPVLAALWVSALARPAFERPAASGPESARALARIISAVARGERSADGLELQQLQNGLVLVRERFADLDHRRGWPAVLLATRRPAASRTVVIVPAPLTAPHAAALAGHWLEQGAIDALVLAGSEEGHRIESDANEAFALGHELADSSFGRGLVVALRRSTGACVARATLRAHAAAAARAFLEQRRPLLTDCTVATDAARVGADVEVEIPESSTDSVLGPRTAAPSLATTSALALALTDIRLSSTHPTLEDLLVLRRLVLEPLLAAEAAPPISLALSAAAAESVGYKLLGPARLPNGSDGMLLLPGPDGGGLALVVRRGGAHGLVLEVPRAGSGQLRALALRLAKPLGADAVLVGLEVGEGALGNESFAAAHAAAVWPRPGRSSSVVSVREADTAQGSLIGLAVWGGARAEPLAGRVADALAFLELAVRPQPLDLATREQAARSVFGDTPLVSITVAPASLQAQDIADNLRPLRLLEAFPVYDAEFASVAETLAAALPERALDAPESVLDLARVAVSERSVVAVRALEEVVSGTACRAGVLRADSGVYFMLVARRDHRLRVGLVPMIFGAVSRSSERFAAPTLAGCVAKLTAGGVCRVEARP